MIKIYNALNNSLPMLGGSAGAISQVNNYSDIITLELIFTTIIIGIVGAVAGYLVKLLLDKIFKK